MLTIDDQLHADEAGDPYRAFRQDLWYRILDSSSGGVSDRWHRRVARFQDRSLFNFMKSGLSAELGIWFIAGLVLVYLLLVGPGLYFFLKRKGKLPWVVWIEPGIVVVYVGMIFLTGYLTRGVLTQARTVTLFQWQQGDRVMQTSNNYDLEVFNGEIGRIAGFDSKEQQVLVELDDRVALYPPNRLEELELAYAVTIHKSQGSEFPCVVIVLHSQHFVMLRRNLLYTAITRGKRLVIVVGARQALEIATKTETTQHRETLLVERLQHNLAGDGEGWV